MYVNTVYDLLGYCVHCELIHTHRYLPLQRELNGMIEMLVGTAHPEKAPARRPAV